MALGDLEVLGVDDERAEPLRVHVGRRALRLPCGDALWSDGERLVCPGYYAIAIDESQARRLRRSSCRGGIRRGSGARFLIWSRRGGRSLRSPNSSKCRARRSTAGATRISSGPRGEARGNHSRVRRAGCGPQLAVTRRANELLTEQIDPNGGSRSSRPL